jgi:hypothetical protein
MQNRQVLFNRNKQTGSTSQYNNTTGLLYYKIGKDGVITNIPSTVMRLERAHNQ